MPFAGGPFNHFSLEGVARMVEVLRADTAHAAPGRRLGLVSNLSGIFGKQAYVLLSNQPNPRGYGYEDITAAVAERDVPVPLHGDYVGPATIVGYTVVFQKGQVSHGVAICDTPAGQRTVARSDDEALLGEMMRREFCGCVVEISTEGTFSSPPARRSGLGGAGPELQNAERRQPAENPVRRVDLEPAPGKIEAAGGAVVVVLEQLAQGEEVEGKEVA